MSVPDFQSLMLPVLTALSHGQPTTVSEIRKQVAIAEKLSADDIQQLLPSGRQAVFANRIAWALVHMQRAGLVARVSRGVYERTRTGDELLRSKPSRIDMKALREYPSYAQWRTTERETSSTGEKLEQSTEEATPEEILDQAAKALDHALEAEVLDRVRNAEPGFLEQVIVDLLVAMGYGGGDGAMGQVTGGSGDGGIDGKIREDALGLDELCLQAKKYAASNAVGASDLRNFAGAIAAAGTTKGVFVTTSDFTRAAREFVSLSPTRIVLINGPDLARFMVEHGIGVRLKRTLAIRRIDEDYFRPDDE
ncbi:restriction endonuclease [Candidatus Palauibacter sp.]|uniref:restriction endonuclease n=1 Tax=Candidatus Palauibacter sp. TaxID=3101350 RepID=UPI003B022F4D